MCLSHMFSIIERHFLGTEEQQKKVILTLFGDAAFLLTVGSFLLTVEPFYLQLTILAFLLTAGAFILTALASLLTVGAFFSYSGEVHLIRALRDCKQRSLTVSKKAPTVSNKASPLFGPIWTVKWQMINVREAARQMDPRESAKRAPEQPHRWFGLNIL